MSGKRYSLGWTFYVRPGEVDPTNPRAAQLNRGWYAQWEIKADEGDAVGPFTTEAQAASVFLGPEPAPAPCKPSAAMRALDDVTMTAALAAHRDAQRGQRLAFEAWQAAEGADFIPALELYRAAGRRLDEATAYAKAIYSARLGAILREDKPQ